MSSPVPQHAQDKLNELMAIANGEGTASDGVNSPQADPHAFDVPEGKVTAPPRSDDQSGPQTQPQSDDFRQRYLTLQGKYDAEVPTLRQQLSEMQSQIARLQAERELALEFDDDDDDDAISGSSIDVDEDYVRSMVSDDLIEEFGLDYWMTTLQIQMKLASQANPSSKVDDGRLKMIEGQLNQQRFAAFQSELDALVPNWRVINKQANWLSFLTQIEPLSGRPYQDLVDESQDQFNAARIAAIFDTFFRQTGQSQLASFNRESWIMPSNQGSSPVGEGSQGKISFAEWNARLQNVLKGGKSPLEMHEEQNKLMAMYHEGKVQKAEENDDSVVPSFI